MAEQQLVVFTLGSERYGVEIMVVREIVTMQRVTPVPGSPPQMEGVTNLRGQIIPVIDLKKCLGQPYSKPGPEARIMVIDIGSAMVGCIVDSVAEVLRISTEVVTPPDSAMGVRAEYLQGIAKVGDSLVILLDLRRALTQETMMAEAVPA